MCSVKSSFTVCYTIWDRQNCIKFGIELCALFRASTDISAGLRLGWAGLQFIEACLATTLEIFLVPSHKV